MLITLLNANFVKTINKYIMATKKSANTNRMKLISARAKEIYASGKAKKWTDAIKKASTELKKEGKL